MEALKNRTRKVSSLFIRNKWSKAFRPKITICGNWLKDAGFEIGENVKIEVSENQLIITKI